MAASFAFFRAVFKAVSFFSSAFESAFAAFAVSNIGAVGAGRPVPAGLNPGPPGRDRRETPPIHNPLMKARQIFDKIANL